MALDSPASLAASSAPAPTAPPVNRPLRLWPAIALVAAYWIVWAIVTVFLPATFTQFQALTGKTWNHPVIANNKLLLRNSEEAACYDLMPPTTDL